MNSVEEKGDRLSKLSPAKRVLVEMLKSKRLNAEECHDRLPAIPRVSREANLPLSFAQQRMWVLHQFDPDSAAYSDQVIVRLKGQLNVPVLQRALSEVINRHEALRTTFPVVNGDPVQRIAPPGAFVLPVTDLLHIPGGEREEQLRRVASHEIAQPFRLDQGPLLRARLIRKEPDEYVLIIVLQHIIFDGWSRGILIRELATLYAAFPAGLPSPLPELSIQYADFACWQREWLADERLETQIAYWRQQLTGELPQLELCTDRPRPAVQTFRGANRFCPIAGRLKDSLEELSRRQQGTLFMTLLAAFMTLLYRYTGQQDIIVGTPAANRGRAETDTLIGAFVNTLALRAGPSGHITFNELMARVRDTVLQAQAHQDVPFEMLVETLMPRRDLSRTPLFQVMFERNVPMPAVQLPGVELSQFDLHSGTAQFDLTLAVLDGTDNGLTVSVDYNTDLFDEDRIIRMLGHFQVLLAGIAEDSQRPLHSLALLAEAERQELLFERNQTHTQLPSGQCFNELFEAQARRTPGAVAVSSESEELSYLELDQRSNQLAHFLRKLGIQREMKVVVCMKRSPDMLVALLAILKAGGAYLPLDPEYPPDRIEYIIRDARAPVLLTHAAVTNHLSAEPCRIVCIDANGKTIADQPRDHAPAVVLPDNLAYVIYTSGSTGKPKGVLIRHGGMVNHLWAKVLALDLDEHDVLAQTASCSFDISIWQFLAALLKGGKVQIFGDEIAHDGSRLLEEVERSGISVIETVPALLGIMLDHAQKTQRKPTLTRLRWLISTGEALPVALCQSWWKCYPLVPLMNAYGPTECSDDISHCIVAPPLRDGLKYAPIGRPICNTQAYVLDEWMQPLPVGTTGELYVGGEGVGRGYVNRPELTAEKFLPDCFHAQEGRRLYRTGDRVRWLADGALEFMERVDYQVKIRGFRIELGEIESRLTQYPGVSQAVVLAREDMPGDKRLVAYYTVTDKRPQESQEQTKGVVGAELIRAYLAASLPDYMVPAAYVALEKIPLTTNRKVDRKALPPPSADAYVMREYEAPKGEIETLVAAICANVLKVERVGRHENFFELGGNSLLVVTLIERLRHAGLHVDVRSVFSAPTVADLAQASNREVRVVEVPPNLIPDPARPAADSSKVLVVRI